MRARSLNKCRQCGNRAELGVTNEARTGTIWLCKRCAEHLGSTIAPTLGEQIAAGELPHALRIQSGVQREPGVEPRYRPVVVITGLGEQREYVGEWRGDEADATREAATMAAEMRKIVGLRARELGNN